MGGRTIGHVAEQAGCSVQTVRHYEAIGLLPPPVRTDSGQRRYEPADASRLGFIRHARALGFTIPAIRELLDLAADPSRPCEAADAIAQRQLDVVEARIAALTGLRDELRRMIEACSHGRVDACRVIETLADHTRCAGAHLDPVQAGGVPPA